MSAVGAEKIDEINTEIKPKVMAIAGVQQWISVMDKSGDGAVIVIYDNEAAATAAKPQVKVLWGEVAKYLKGTPDVYEGDVVASAGA